MKVLIDRQNARQAGIAERKGSQNPVVNKEGRRETAPMDGET